MARVYVTQLGKAVDVPDDYTPEQTKQHIRGMLPQQPMADLGTQEPDFEAEHQRLQESQLRDMAAAEDIRAREVDPEAEWANAAKSMLHGARAAYAGGMRGVGEMLPEAAGRLKEFLVEDMGDYNQTLNTRQKMAHDDPNFDFQDSFLGWQGNVPDTARALVQESGPTALFAAEMAVPGMVAGKALKAGRAIKAGTQTLKGLPKVQQPLVKALAKYEDVVSHLPEFFQRGAMVAPVVAGMRASEGLTEAGMAAQEATQRGKTAAEIKATTAKALAANMTLGVMDVAQATVTLGMLPAPVTKALGNVSRNYIGKMPMGLLKSLAGVSAAAVGEGQEEAIQEEISTWAQGEGFDPKVVYNPMYAREKHPESFNIGALTGIVGAGGHIGLDAMIEKNIDRVAPEQYGKIFKDEELTPEAQKARREEVLAVQQKAAATALAGEDGPATVETTMLEPLTVEEAGVENVNKFTEMSDEDLAVEAAHYIASGEEDAPAVLAHRERIGRSEVKASVRKDKARAQAALDAAKAGAEAQQRREFAELSRNQRRQLTEESMLDSAAFPQDQQAPLPDDPIAAMRGAQSYEELVSLASRLDKEGLLKNKNKAAFRREEQRLAKLHKPGFERFVPGAESSTQTKKAGVSIEPAQSQELAPTDLTETPVQPALPTGEVAPQLGPGDEVQTWDDSPLRESAFDLKTIPAAKKIIPTRTGARATLQDDSYLHFEAVDYIDPKEAGVVGAVKKHGVKDVGGVPAYIKDNPDGSKTIVLSKGFSYATTANQQSLSHELFHAAKSLGVLTNAEVAAVYTRYFKDALGSLGAKTKTNVRKMLDMDPNAVVSEGVTVKNVLDKVEELAADGYGDWAPKHRNTIQKIWDWLKDLATADLLAPGSKAEAEKVFTKIRTGEGLQAIKKRLETAAPTLAQVKRSVDGVKPAIWTENKVYTGTAHWEAFQEALEDDPTLVDDNEQARWMDGFLFPNGKFYNRAETLDRIGVETSEELAAVKAGKKPEEAYDDFEETNPEVSDEEVDALVQQTRAQVKFDDADFEKAAAEASKIADEFFGDKWTNQRSLFERRVTMRLLGEEEKDLPGHEIQKKKISAQVREKNIQGQFTHNGINYDQRGGIGAVPLQSNVKYEGFTVFMTPEEFLSLNPDRGGKIEPGIEKKITAGEPIASPWMKVNVLENGRTVVTAHEGRGRAQVLADLIPGQTIPVNIFPSEELNGSLQEMRDRDLSEDIVGRRIYSDKRAAAETSVAPSRVIWGGWDAPYSDTKLGVSAQVRGEASQEIGSEKTSLIQQANDLVNEKYMAQVRGNLDNMSTKGFKTWWSEAAPSMKEEDGDPIQLYHGSFFDVQDLDLGKVSQKNYLGRALYLTTSPADASNNYADPNGADRVGSVYDISDQVENYIDEQTEYENKPINDVIQDVLDNYGITPTEKERAFIERAVEDIDSGGLGAFSDWVGKSYILDRGAGRVYPMWMAAKNPVIMGAGTTELAGEQTTWEYEYTFDEEEDTEEEGGSALDLFDAISRIMGSDALIEIQEHLEGTGTYWSDGVPITARAFYDAAQRSEAAADRAAVEMWDYGEESSVGELVRRVFEDLGHDAVVMDASVFAGMDHTRGTKHFITWDTGNVKSSYNKGEFDRQKNNISAQVRQEDLPLRIETDPKYFKNWFKNSVAVNEDGTPKMFLHGRVRDVPEQIERFDLDRATVGQTGLGFYFTDASRVSNNYNQPRPGRPYGQTYPVYLSVQNPYVWDKMIKPGSTEHKTIIDWLDFAVEYNPMGFVYDTAKIDEMRTGEFSGRDLAEAVDSMALRQVLISMGYDGIMGPSFDDFGSPSTVPPKDYEEVFGSKGDSTTIMTFFSDQQKSAFNPGTFSTTDDNLSAQVRSAMARPPGMSEQQFISANTASGVNDPNLNEWFSGKEFRAHRAAVLGRRLQKKLAKIAGQKALGMFGFIYGKKAREYGAALHVYMDLKNEPEAYEKYYDQLTDEQKKVVDMARDVVPNNPKLVALAEEIQEEYDAAGNEAMSAGLIHNLRENYVNRVWRLNGRSASEANQAFGTTTRHRRQRKLPTILQGWADGLDMAAQDAIENLVVYKEEIGRVLEDKALIDRGRRMRINGEPDAPFLLTHMPPKGHKYVKINHPNFKYYVMDSTKDAGVINESPAGDNYKLTGNGISFRKFGIYKKGGNRALRVFDTWDEAIAEIARRGDNTLEIHQRWDKMRREEIYAPKHMGDQLNKILEPGFTSTGMRKALKFNAIIKSMILLTSLFHHMAFARSFWLGTHGSAFDAEGNKLGKHRIFKAYKEGMRMIDAQNEDLEFLIRNGLTLGRLQDWDDTVYRDKSRLLDWMKSKSKVSKALIEKVGELRERQVSFLFKNFGAGLKSQAALIEYAHNLKKYSGKMDPQQIAQYTARLINEDFGGLNWDRMGISKKRQQVMRLLLLAPDWTGSNFLTIKRLGTSILNKGNDPKALRDIYGRFWGGILIKGIMSTLAMNLIMGMLGQGMGDDGELLDGTKHAFEDDWTRLLWADVDVTPLYKLANKVFDGTDDGRRRYFSILGHFKDPFRWALDPTRSAIHKGSPMSRVVLEAIEGSDWKGDGFTTVNELLGRDERGYYKSDGPGHKAGDPKGGKLKGHLVSRLREGGPLTVGLQDPGESQLVSYLISQAKGSTPVQVQETLAAMAGEKAWFDAVLRSFGAHMSPSRGTEFDVMSKRLNKIDNELQSLRLTNRKKYAEERKENATNLRALKALQMTEKKIRAYNRKLVSLEGDERLSDEKKESIKEKYQEKINQIEQQFMDKYGGIA